MDTATGLAEIIRTSNRSAAHIALKFKQTWLLCYPRPLKVIHDQGNEFTGTNVQIHLHRLDIKSVPTTVKNPQANAMFEMMHKTCGDQICTHRKMSRHNTGCGSAGTKHHHKPNSGHGIRCNGLWSRHASTDSGSDRFQLALPTLTKHDRLPASLIVMMILLSKLTLDGRRW